MARPCAAGATRPDRAEFSHGLLPFLRELPLRQTVQVLRRRRIIAPGLSVIERPVAAVLAHWDDVLRLIASVRTGVVSASLMLKRLGSYPLQNGLAQALREIGRIERTLYTLEWLEQPQLRRQRNSTRANPGMPSRVLSASIALANCATAPSKRSSTARAGSPWSQPP